MLRCSVLKMQNCGFCFCWFSNSNSFKSDSEAINLATKLNAASNPSFNFKNSTCLEDGARKRLRMSEHQGEDGQPTYFNQTELIQKFKTTTFNSLSSLVAEITSLFISRVKLII